MDTKLELKLIQTGGWLFGNRRRKRNSNQHADCKYNGFQHHD